MTTEHEPTHPTRAGQDSYDAWRADLHANPDYQAIAEEEAAKSELWLQLVEARQAAGLTQAEVAKRLGVSQAQVARLEKSGYDGYSLNSLRRYVKALGEDFALEVHIQHRNPAQAPAHALP
jgi:predicted XRE-type DNA-binding protein